MSNEASIVVLVTLQRHCARLIRSGADMALKERCPLKVVHVAQMQGEGETESPIKAEVLNDLYALANEAGAEMCVLTAEDLATAVAKYAHEIGVRQIVMGAGESAHGIAEALSELLPGIKILIVEAESI